MIQKDGIAGQGQLLRSDVKPMRAHSNHLALCARSVAEPLQHVLGDTAATAPVAVVPLASRLSHGPARLGRSRQVEHGLLKRFAVRHLTGGPAAAKGIGNGSEITHLGSKHHGDTQTGGFDWRLAAPVWREALPDKGEIRRLGEAHQLPRCIRKVDTRFRPGGLAAGPSLPGERLRPEEPGELLAAFRMSRDEKQPGIHPALPEFSEDAEQPRFFTGPGRGTKEDEGGGAGRGLEAQLPEQGGPLCGAEDGAHVDVEFDAAGPDESVDRQSEGAQSLRVEIACRVDGFEFREEAAGQPANAPVAPEAFVGDAGVDEEGRDAPGARPVEMLRPQFAIHQADHVRADSFPSECVETPEIEGKQADGVDPIPVTFTGFAVAGAGRGGENKLESTARIKRFKKRADSGDFADADCLDPDAAFTRGGGRDPPEGSETMLKVLPVAAPAPHA